MGTFSWRDRWCDSKGKGIQGLTVEAYEVDANGLPTGAAAFSTTTDADGVFEFDSLDDSKLYCIKVINGSETYWLDGPAKTQVRELLVKDRLRLPSGVVVDSNGIPIAGLAVEGTALQLLRVKSDESGLEWVKPSHDSLTVPYCEVYHDANQSIPDATTTTLAFNAEISDDDGMHDPVTNNSRITVPSDGTYLVAAYINFANDANGHRQLNITKNGSVRFNNTVYPASASVPTRMTICGPVVASAGDYFGVSVYQNSGGALDVPAYTEGPTPRLIVMRIA